MNNLSKAQEKNSVFPEEKARMIEEFYWEDVLTKGIEFGKIDIAKKISEKNLDILIHYMFFSTILLFLLSATFWFGGVAHADLNDGLVAYYPFNGNANDESGNEHHGIVYGASLTADRFGNQNKAYSFDGISNYIEIADAADLRAASHIISISLWIKSIYKGPDPLVIIRKGVSCGVPGWHISTGHSQYNSTDILSLEFFGWDGIQDSWRTSVLTHHNEWLHIIGISDSNTAKIYINSSLLSISRVKDDVPINSNWPMTFGTSKQSCPYTSEFFKGIIDDIRIYNRALSDPEIQQLYQEDANSSSHATNITISLVSPSRYRLLGTLVDANKQPACGLALASGRCVFTCGPGSLRCEGGTDTLPLGQFDLTDLPTEADGALNLQTFVFGSMPGLQVVQSDGTARLVDSGASRASSGAINTQRHEVSPGRHRLTGTLVDANNQPACGLALASGRCVFTCGPGSLRCEGGASNLPLGQFELTDLPAEANGALNLQTFVFGSLPGLQVVKPESGGGCSYAIDPASKTFEYPGGTGTVAVSAPSGCAWTAQSNNDWITITAGARGTGPGQVTYTVASHSSSSQRRGTLTIAGQTLTVLQAPKSDDGGGGGGH